MNAICFYCEMNPSTTARLGEVACDECANREIHTTAPVHRMDDKQKAKLLKMVMRALKKG